jgi:hypothetical protein
MGRKGTKPHEGFITALADLYTAFWRQPFLENNLRKRW